MPLVVFWKIFMKQKIFAKSPKIAKVKRRAFSEIGLFLN